MEETQKLQHDSAITLPEKPLSKPKEEVILKSQGPPTVKILGKYARNAKHTDELWYYGYMKHTEAELALKNHGHFLVRRLECDENGPYYVVSVFWLGNHYHFRIQQTANGQYFLNRYYSSILFLFETIGDLIWFHVEYKNKPIHDDTGIELKWYAQRERWFIYNEQIMLECELGKGAFGEVFRGIYRASIMRSKQVAIKMMLIKTDITDDHRIRFLREAQIMLNIKHSNIICVYGVCIGKDPLMIVMELAEGGSLFDRLKKQRGVVPAPHEENENYAYEICAGMAYLEEKPVVHRDLAARNCLLTKSGHIKIADFGLSALCKEYQEKERTKIPFRWTSPETLMTQLYTTKSDVWSFGVVIYEIYSLGKVPYGQIKDGHQVRSGIKKGTLRLEPPSAGPPKNLDKRFKDKKWIKKMAIKHGIKKTQ
uniref:Tyrosine-protein kinase n=1 Tax=Acrobeloides nanus TaxID=290746 RepID=A0A914DS02_9BILA